MSLGAQIAEATPSERFSLHQQANRSGFSATDELLAKLVARALRGDQVLTFTQGKRRSDADSLALKGVDEDSRALLTGLFSRDAHQQRGAWYLPEGEKLPAGICQLPWWSRQEPRFTLLAAEAQRCVVELDTPDAILTWSFLQPLMEALYLPLKLRSGYWLGDRRPDQMEKDWATVERTYGALGVEASAAFETFKDGRRWASLDAEAVIAVRTQLLGAWAASPAEVSQRAIYWHIDQLIDRYYGKARNGQAERSKVINKTLERSLTAAFGGDWLAFLAYIEEQPHPKEKIATAVQSTAIVASGGERARAAAEATGVPAAEIERILAAYWDGASQTPVDRRVAALRDWWQAFDDLHARQAKGMASPWGVMSDGLEARDVSWMEEDGRYLAQGYERLGDRVCRLVDELWGTTVLPRWPDRLVTEPFPQAALARTLGVAGRFWHAIALTCWFLCEGPYSRTDINGIPGHYDADIKELDAIGCPVDRQLFEELRAAQKHLRKRAPDPGDSTRHDVGHGMEIVITVQAGGDKYDGFEQLRDVITKYRRAWAAAYLDTYLRQCWQTDLRAVGDEYHRQVADKGKPPTAKQFAKLASDAANNWFGGRLDQVCSALQLPAPDPPGYERMLPSDPRSFIARLVTQMGGQRWKDQSDDLPQEQRTVLLRRAELAERSLPLIQQWEATGERPPLKGQSWARGYLEEAYGHDVEAGWEWYLDHIAGAIKLESEKLAAVVPSPPERAAPAAGDREDLSGEPAVRRGGLFKRLLG